MLYPYDREAAVAYARRWALARNPLFYNFDALGGDCTNFISQCLWKGKCPMNFTPETGWYYLSLQRRAPAWSGVEAFGRFLRENRSFGPRAQEADLYDLAPGDVIQLCREGQCYHSLIVTQISSPDPSGIHVCAHSNDALDRPLSSYSFDRAIGYHILGAVLY